MGRRKKLKRNSDFLSYHPNTFHLSFSPSPSFMFTQSKGKKLLTKIQTKWNMLNHLKPQLSHQAKKTTNQHLHKHGNEKRIKNIHNPKPWKPLAIFTQIVIKDAKKNGSFSLTTICEQKEKKSEVKDSKATSIQVTVALAKMSRYALFSFLLFCVLMSFSVVLFITRLASELLCYGMLLGFLVKGISIWNDDYGFFNVLILLWTLYIL